MAGPFRFHSYSVTTLRRWHKKWRRLFQSQQVTMPRLHALQPGGDWKREKQIFWSNAERRVEQINTRVGSKGEGILCCFLLGILWYGDHHHWRSPAWETINFSIGLQVVAIFLTEKLSFQHSLLVIKKKKTILELQVTFMLVYQHPSQLVWLPSLYWT